MSNPNSFEPYFHEFVRMFGGTVLEEASGGKTADYLFSSYNVLAELKAVLEKFNGFDQRKGGSYSF